MKRRNTIKILAAGTVGLTSLAWWQRDAEWVQDLLHNSFFSSTEQKLIRAIADTILPRADQKYGALDLGTDNYMIAYFEKCEPEEIHALIKSQLEILNTRSNAQHGTDFWQGEQIERESLLIELSSSEVQEEKDFFNLMKRHTLIGFNTTEKVMVEHYGYKVVPGEFIGCKDYSREEII